MSEGLEGAIRRMAGKGDIGVCVAPAFKDIGINVPLKFFIRAALQNREDPLKLADELGFVSVELEGIDLMRLYREYKQIRAQGIYPFIKLGAPREDLGILPQHLNSVIGTAIVENKPALELGGIPPFGEESGNVFPIQILGNLMPKDGILLLKRKE